MISRGGFLGRVAAALAGMSVSDEILAELDAMLQEEDSGAGEGGKIRTLSMDVVAYERDQPVSTKQVDLTSNPAWGRELRTADGSTTTALEFDREVWVDRLVCNVHLVGLGALVPIPYSFSPIHVPVGDTLNLDWHDNSFEWHDNPSEFMGA